MMGNVMLYSLLVVVRRCKRSCMSTTLSAIRRSCMSTLLQLYVYVVTVVCLTLLQLYVYVVTVVCLMLLRCYSCVDGASEDLDLGDEVEFTVSHKSARMCAENIHKLSSSASSNGKSHSSPDEVTESVNKDKLDVFVYQVYLSILKSH